MENNNAEKANNNNNQEKIEDQNPSNSNSTGSGETVAAQEGSGGVDGRGSGGNRSRRTPFTDLSQEDADLALARTLQEQERAYMMLRMNADGIHYGSWGAASYEYDDEEDEDFDDPSEEEHGGHIVDVDEEDEVEEDAFDVHAHAEAGENKHQGIELDPSAYSSDEAYARALQDAEEWEVAARLLAFAGINEVFVGEAGDDEDHGGNSQGTERVHGLWTFLGNIIFYWKLANVNRIWSTSVLWHQLLVFCLSGYGILYCTVFAVWTMI